PQAARVLTQWLAERRVNASGLAGRNLAVFGALADKDVAGIVAPLAPHVARWFAGGLDAETPRGLPAADLAARMRGAVADLQVATLAKIGQALDAASRSARESDRILAFGSFFVAAAALEWARQNGFRAVDIG
ncbi:MAG: glutamate ligase domain-containing protein, partial [Rudaea sp.]